MVDTNTHPRKFVVRGPNEPEQPFGGQVWVNTSGGNVELNQYNASTPEWELLLAHGPDTPQYPVDGSMWSDTTIDGNKVYDAETSSWVETNPEQTQTVYTYERPVVSGGNLSSPAAFVDGDKTSSPGWSNGGSGETVHFYAPDRFDALVLYASYNSSTNSSFDLLDPSGTVIDSVGISNAGRYVWELPSEQAAGGSYTFEKTGGDIADWDPGDVVLRVPHSHQI